MAANFDGVKNSPSHLVSSGAQRPVSRSAPSAKGAPDQRRSGAVTRSRLPKAPVSGSAAKSSRTGGLRG